MYHDRVGGRAGLLIGAGLLALIAAACGGSSTDSAENSTVPPTTAAVSTTGDDATTTSVAAPTTTAGTTTTAEPEPALSEDAGSYTIRWESLTNSFWDPNAGSAADPFFFIHTIPEEDGFFFSFEMFTTGYGALWQGELGDVAISCNEVAPGPNVTGICPHFDPDGPGAIGDLNADFLATGSVTIDRLDEGGYAISVNEIVFSDGSSITSFEMTGP